MKERNVDIINNDVFRNSNLCYENKLKETKANGKSNFPKFEVLRIGDSKENPNYLGKNQNIKILLLKSAKSKKKRASGIIKKLFGLSLAHYGKY